MFPRPTVPPLWWVEGGEADRCTAQLTGLRQSSISSALQLDLVSVPTISENPRNSVAQSVPPVSFIHFMDISVHSLLSEFYSTSLNLISILLSFGYFVQQLFNRFYPSQVFNLKNAQ